MSLNQMIAAAAATTVVAVGAVAAGSKLAAAEHGRSASEIAATEKLTGSEGKLPEEVVDGSSDDARLETIDTDDKYQLRLFHGDASKLIVDALGVSWHRFGWKSTPGAAKAVMAEAGWRLRLQNAFTLTHDGRVNVFPGHNSRATSILATHIPSEPVVRAALLHGDLYPQLMNAADARKASVVALTIFGAGDNGHDFADAFTAAYTGVQKWLASHDSTTIRRVILVVYTEAEYTAARKVLYPTPPETASLATMTSDETEGATGDSLPVDPATTTETTGDAVADPPATLSPPPSPSTVPSTVPF